tara:strand:- start:2255 stop:2782 length:528 start_codon:yes stop_codon:yes gene_type:complete
MDNTSYCRKNNWSTKLEELINKQINIELTASHTYNALYSYFLSDSVGFPGLASFFKKSADEETEHAREFIEYQNTRGGKVNITSLHQPSFNFDNSSQFSIMYQAIKYTLELEQSVYESIMNISRESDDHGLEDFLDKFVKEQLDTQYNLGIKLKQLEIIGKDGHGLIHFDKEMLN